MPTSHPKILRCACHPVDPAWLNDELVDLERLAEAGDALQVVAKLGELTRAPRRLETAARETV